jgi:UDP-N-acetylmuramoyl-L-alanyl-D-glutamate--2,6-diaminopimelate ligase
VSDRIPPVLRPEHPLARSLAGLVSEFGLHSIGSLDAVEVTGVTLRSGEVQPGDLFVGMPGAASHGAGFAQAARESGAVALLTDQAGAELAAEVGLPIVVVDSPRAALGDISAWVYQTNEHPPLMLGITGTNGKTSTAYLLEGILKQLGLVTGLSTTAERHIGDLTVVSRLTTPEASEIHALLARMRESEVGAAVLEVCALALSLNRVD